MRLDRRYLYPLLLIVVLTPVYFVLGDYYRHIFILVYIWAFLAMGWNILGGYGGQHSLGHGLYMGIGAYATAYLFSTFGLSPWIGMIAAAIMATAVAWFIGWVVFHYQLRGAYFALVTIALTEVAVYVASNIPAINGAQGIQLKVKMGWQWMQPTNAYLWFYVAGVLMIVAGLLVTQYYSRQRFFYYLEAVRENEEAAEALGVNTVREKVKANMFSAAWCAIGGVLYLQYFLYVAPRSVFGELISVQILLYAIVGGTGTVWGPVVGAAILVPLTEITRSQLGATFSGASLLIYGIAMVLAMLFMPFGVVGLLSRSFSRFRDNFATRDEVAPVAGEDS